MQPDCQKNIPLPNYVKQSENGIYLINNQAIVPPSGIEPESIL